MKIKTNGAKLHGTSQGLLLVSAIVSLTMFSVIPVLAKNNKLVPPPAPDEYNRVVNFHDLGDKPAWAEPAWIIHENKCSTLVIGENQVPPELLAEYKHKHPVETLPGKPYVFTPGAELDTPYQPINYSVPSMTPAVTRANSVKLPFRQRHPLWGKFRAFCDEIGPPAGIVFGAASVVVQSGTFGRLH